MHMKDVTALKIVATNLLAADGYWLAVWNRCTVWCVFNLYCWIIHALR